MRALSSLLHQPTTKWVGLITMNGFILIIFCLLHAQYFKQSPLKTEAIATQLSDIQSQLAQIQQQLSKPSEKIDLKAIDENVNHLENLVKELKPKNQNEMNQLMQENNTVLSTKLETIQTLLNSLDKKQHLIKFLPATALPFQIISIDSIQHSTVVSVLYHFKTTALEKRDALAGWTVLHVDFGQQAVEFENVNKEHVVVKLENEEGEQDA